MKKIRCSILLTIACLLAAGCVVRSVSPWLTDDSRVEDPSLLGAWHDAKAKSVVFFTGTPLDYEVMLANGREAPCFTATLHRIDDLLLLQVGPQAPDDLSGASLLPGFLLFKAVLEDERLTLYGFDTDTFEERAGQAEMALVAGGSRSDGYVLSGSTEEVEAFLREQLADPGLFSQAPLYAFRKLPATAPESAPVPTDR